MSSFLHRFVFAYTRRPTVAPNDSKCTLFTNKPIYFHEFVLSASSSSTFSFLQRYHPFVTLQKTKVCASVTFDIFIKYTWFFIPLSWHTFFVIEIHCATMINFCTKNFANKILSFAVVVLFHLDAYHALQLIFLSCIFG